MWYAKGERFSRAQNLKCLLESKRDRGSQGEREWGSGEEHNESKKDTNQNLSRWINATRAELKVRSITGREGRRRGEGDWHSVCKRETLRIFLLISCVFSLSLSIDFTAKSFDQVAPTVQSERVQCMFLPPYLPAFLYSIYLSFSFEWPRPDKQQQNKQRTSTTTTTSLPMMDNSFHWAKGGKAPDNFQLNDKLCHYLSSPLPPPFPPSLILYLSAVGVARDKAALNGL